MYKLRELEERDLPTINKWRADPELVAMLGGPFRYINPEVDRRWFDNYMNHRDSAIRCAIVTDQSDEILGLASLTNIDRFNQSAQFHIMIGANANQGRGAGSFAVKEMLRHAFFDMNLRRVESTFLEDNTRSQHVCRKMGFVLEGVMREAAFKDGRFVNLALYSILKSDFIEKMKESE